jgi:hypothetical protein
MSDSEKEKPKKKEEDPTPYGTEYSLSNRAGCRQCKEKIAKVLTSHFETLSQHIIHDTWMF